MYSPPILICLLIVPMFYKDTDLQNAMQKIYIVVEMGIRRYSTLKTRPSLELEFTANWGLS